MNEQLVVKNFGPIKDATVDFKRVTVFIGPTGGGKSTLAKLKMVMSENDIVADEVKANLLFEKYDLISYCRPDYSIKWFNSKGYFLELKRDNVVIDPIALTSIIKPVEEGVKEYFTSSEIIKRIENLLANIPANSSLTPEEVTSQFLSKVTANFSKGFLKGHLSLPFSAHYIPAERLLISTLNSSWPSLIDAKVDFPQTLIAFAKMFLQACKTVKHLKINFLNIEFEDNDGRSRVRLADGNNLQLHETASGIQSVTPLLISLEHLARNVEDEQSFIIEEPELNLFPIAQFELVKTLVEKCAQLDGKNDLVLTTHSPYVLTALNLLCYAFRIAQQDEATAKKVAKLIPRHCWIDPDQFAAYYVDLPSTKRKQQVRSIINKKTGLIEENELDTASYELSDIFDKLVRLRKPAKTTARVK